MNKPGIKTYTTGLIASVLLTAAAFASVAEHNATGHVFPTHGELFGGLVALAVLQLIVQLHYFLHVGRQTETRDIAAFAFGVVLIAMVVGGSLWIMANLSHSQAVPFYNSSVAPQNSTD